MATMSMPMNFGFDGGNAGYQQMMSRVATATSQLATTTVNQQENTFYQAVRKTQDFCDITTLVIGDYGRNKALDAYRGMDMQRGSATSDYINSINKIETPDLKITMSLKDANGKTIASQSSVFNANSFSAQSLAQLRQNGSAVINGTTYTVDNHEEFKKAMSAYDKKFDYDRQLRGSVSRGDQISSMKNLYQSAAKHMDGNANLKSIQDAINSGKGTEHVKRAANRVDRDLTDKIRNCSSGASSNLVSQLNRMERTGILNNTQKESLFADIDRDAHLSDTDKSMLKQLLDSRNEERNFISSGLVEAGGINAGRNALYAGRRIVMRNLMGPDFYQFYAMAKTGVAIAKGTTRIVRGTMMNARIKHYDRLIKVSPVADRMTQRVYNRAMGFAPGIHSSHVTNHLTQKREQIIDQKQFVDSLRGKSYHEKIALKRGRKESILDAKSSLKRKKLVERRDRAARSGNKRRADRIDRRREALDRRSQRRFDRRSRRHARTDRANAIKERFRNIGKKLLKPIRIIAAPIQWIVNLPRMIAQKIATYVLMPVAMFILKYMIGIPIGFLLIFYFLYSFISNIVPDLNNLAHEWASDRVAQLNEQNYLQYILDEAGSDIAYDFYEICCTDATQKFSKSNKQKSKELAARDKADDDFKSNISTTWYATVNYGEIGHIWVWEEADNISKYDKNIGKHTAGSQIFQKGFVDSDDYKGYIKNLGSRQTITNVNENMVPIICMLKQRYIGDIDFETFPTALGYFYYMYAMSHDIARYDTNRHKGEVFDDVHYTDNKGYAYRIDDACERNTLYSLPISWDSGSKSVIGRENEACKNIFIHGDKTKLSKDVLSKTLGIHFFEDNHAIFSKTVKQWFPDKHTGGQGWWIIDDSKAPSTVTASKQASFSPGSYEDSAGNVTGISGGTCTHVGIGKYDENCTKCGCDVHEEHSTACCDYGCGLEEHTHSEACYDEDGKLICTLEEHTHSESCGIDTSTCSFAQANGGNNPGDGIHKHEWNEADGGCYVRVAYCKGHCGGHVTPVSDLVEMMTYQGLAMQDNFKTTHFLTREEIVGKDFTSLLNIADAVRKKIQAEDSPFASVTGWRGYWYSQAMKWYIPYPRSIWGLGSTMWNKVLKSFGTEQSSDSPDKDDIELFTGWFTDDSGDMDSYWLSTLENYYGSFYKPKESKQRDGTNNGDEKYQMAKEMWSEPVIAKEWALKFPSIPICAGSIGGMTGGKPLSDAEIAEIMANLGNIDASNLSPARAAIIQEALGWVGNIGYKQSYHASELVNGGYTDCSGFVTHLFNHQNPSFCTGYTYTSSTLHNMGTPDWTGIQPGDILSKNGHAVLFVSLDGDKVETIESTSTDGKEGPGTVVHKTRSMRQMMAQGYNLVKFPE